MPTCLGFIKERNMNISKYKVLLTAVDMGSFSGAAQKLGYTQSGLTHMMNALEFATDQYAQVNMTWHMKGMIFNRIPLIKHLKLREIIVFNGLAGSLSDRNNPALRHPGLFELPEGTGPMNGVPFLEVGAGIENIFQLFRVVYYYRITHRDNNLTWLGKWGGIRFGVYTDF